MRVIFLDIDGVLVNRRSLKERSGLRAVADHKCVCAPATGMAATRSADAHRAVRMLAPEPK